MNARLNLAPLLCSLVLLLSALADAISYNDDWNHGVDTAYDYFAELSLTIPPRTVVGDLLFLSLSRTDGPLPSIFEDKNGGSWKRSASCFKEHNGQRMCYSIEKHCKRSRWRTDADGVQRQYCREFLYERRADDLCTVIFTRKAVAEDLTRNGRVLEFKLYKNYGYPAWAMLLSISGASGAVRGVRTESCDHDVGSRFPVVTQAQPGDLLLLHMAFDDSAKKGAFLAPSKFTPLLAHVSGHDEAGFLYGGPVVFELSSSTSLNTPGSGGSHCKDALITVVLNGDETVIPGNDHVFPPTAAPTMIATKQPTTEPSQSYKPTSDPSIFPSETPSSSRAPTTQPSATPSQTPSVSIEPTSPPSTPKFSVPPTQTPSVSPTASMRPSANPSVSPTPGFPLAVKVGDAQDNDVVKLGKCEGDCDKDWHCAGNLICYQRNEGDMVPGCNITQIDEWDLSDFCVDIQDVIDGNFLRL